MCRPTYIAENDRPPNNQKRETRRRM